MNAEIIAVGTELLLGHTINTDAATVARELSAFGIDVMHTQVVGDNSSRLEECLHEALGRSDLVFTTGGLGPTDDDLTKETVARITGRPLREHADSMARLLEYFGPRTMSNNQLKQAWLPDGATAFPNTIGTAPGCAVPAPGGKWVVLLPGPPFELIPMLEQAVRPFLQDLTHNVIVSHMVHTFGIGEGLAAERLDELLQGANPSAAPYASAGEMFVRVTAKGATLQEAEELAQPLLDAVRQRLGDVVYGTDIPSLEAAIVPELIRRGQTVATAESCTGGLVAKRITDQPGASAVFGTGLVTYANSAKEQLLGVPEGMLHTHGAVSEPVARAMAEGVRRVAGSDYGLALTGIAGPGGGSGSKPVGLVYIALATPDDTFVHVMRPKGRYMGREWTRERAASHAFDLLRRHLSGLPMDYEVH